MISTFFHNKVLSKEASAAKVESIKAVDKVVAKNISPKSMLSNGTLCGAMFGLGLGVGDSVYSNYAQRRDIKRALKAYKNSTISQKKAAILQLHNNGMTVKEYKNNIKSFMEFPLSLSILKRGVLYASIAAIAGYAIHKLNKSSQKKN